MEVKRILGILWKWSWLILLAVAVSSGASYWSSMQMPRVYKTSTSLMVGQFIQSPNPKDQDFRISAYLAANYARQVTGQPIIAATIETLELETDWQVLAEQINAFAEDQTVVIEVVGTDPVWLQMIANELARQLILHSPTIPDEEEEQHRVFINGQLIDLEQKIQQGEAELAELQSKLAEESSARAIQELQAQITALEAKITSWQTNYTDMLEFYTGGRTNYLSVEQPAFLPTTPISPAIPRNVALAALVGFILATLGALLIEYLDDTIKTREDVDAVLNIPTLGQIGKLPKRKEPSEQLVVVNDPQGQTAEAYRSLRTNLHFTTIDEPNRTWMVTSAIPGEGKSITAANLAAIIAQAGKSVILVDADLRRPSLHRIFRLPNEPGLTNLLLEEGESIEEVLIPTGVPNLRLLPSGAIPPNSAELLASQSFKYRLEQLRKQADIILFDSSPVLAVADPSILGTMCDGVLMVIDTKRTRSEMARQAKEAIGRVGARLIGVVLNRSNPKQIYQTYYFSEVQGKRRSSRNELIPADREARARHSRAT